jgi:hypothetical protein
MARKTSRRVSRFAKEEKFGEVYAYLLDSGFTEKEALWGANEPLDLNSEQVKELIEHRVALIEMYMRDGFTYQQSRERASQDLDAKLESRNIKETNLFYEISP